MKQQKIYEANDKLISIIADNYNILQSLGAFGINLGFGDKTVQQVCEGQGVDTYTFLTIINYTSNGHRHSDDAEKMHIPTLINYLKSSHEYLLGFFLPFIRRQLVDGLDQNESLAKLILKLFDEYATSLKKHMKYEEKMVFPYVEDLQQGLLNENINIETYSVHHNQIGQKLRELKNIIIKYLPSDPLRNNQLTASLHNLYNCEQWLQNHGMVEDDIFLPAIKRLEAQQRQQDVTAKISSMIQPSASQEQLSDREKDVIVALVQGMSNKEIAEHLFISINTVITHRRNIARKLQIHSPAGLTIYAIVNNLVDIKQLNI